MNQRKANRTTAGSGVNPSQVIDMVRKLARSIKTQHTQDTGGFNAPEPPVTTTHYVSDIDGATVVELDTTEDTGTLRVYLNDSPIWDRDPEQPAP